MASIGSRQRAAYYRLVGGESEARVARRFRVSIRTVRRWVADVRTRDDLVSLQIRAQADRGGEP